MAATNAAAQASRSGACVIPLNVNFAKQSSRIGSGTCCLSRWHRIRDRWRSTVGCRVSLAPVHGSAGRQCGVPAVHVPLAHPRTDDGNADDGDADAADADDVNARAGVQVRGNRCG